MNVKRAALLATVGIALEGAAWICDSVSAVNRAQAFGPPVALQMLQTLLAFFWFGALTIFFVIVYRNISSLTASTGLRLATLFVAVLGAAQSILSLVGRLRHLLFGRDALPAGTAPSLWWFWHTVLASAAGLFAGISLVLFCVLLYRSQTPAPAGSAE